MAGAGRRVLGYVGSLVVGGALETVGRKRAQTEVQQKREYVSQQGKQWGAQMDKQMDKSFDDTYAQSFDMRRWQVPKPDMDLMKSLQYTAQTTTQQKREDMTEALKQGAKKTVQEAMSDPLRKGREAVQKVQKAKGQYDAFNQDGTALQQHAEDLSTQKTGEMAQSMGRNAMLKAPGYLMPGPLGFAYRAFFTAKMMGNLGAQYNEMQQAHEQVSGVVKQQRDKRLASMSKSSDEPE